MTPVSPAGGEVDVAREKVPGWLKQARADARYRYPTKGAVQESLFDAAVTVDRLIARLEAAESALAVVAEVRDRMQRRNVDHRHEDEIGHWGVQGRAYFYAGDIYDDYADLDAALTPSAPTEETL